MQRMQLKSRKVVRRLRALAVVVTIAVIAGGCSAPAIDNLPMRPETRHHLLLVGENVTITFTNSTAGPITVAGGEFYDRNQTIFRLIRNGCIATIAASGTCRVEIRKETAGNVNVWYYLGNANRRPLGGVIVR